MFLIEVLTPEKEIKKQYATANLACDAVVKAYFYYQGLGQIVDIKMKTETGYLIYETKTETA